MAENPDRTPDEVKRSEEMSADLHEATAGLRSAFDLWAAEPLGLAGARHTLETNADVIIERDEGKTDQAIALARWRGASRLAAQYRLLPLASRVPQVSFISEQAPDSMWWSATPRGTRSSIEDAQPSMRLHDPGHPRAAEFRARPEMSVSPKQL